MKTRLFQIHQRLLVAALLCFALVPSAFAEEEKKAKGAEAKTETKTEELVHDPDNELCPHCTESLICDICKGKGGFDFTEIFQMEMKKGKSVEDILRNIVTENGECPVCVCLDCVMQMSKVAIKLGLSPKKVQEIFAEMSKSQPESVVAAMASAVQGGAILAKGGTVFIDSSGGLAIDGTAVATGVGNLATSALAGFTTVGGLNAVGGDAAAGAAQDRVPIQAQGSPGLIGAAPPQSRANPGNRPNLGN